MGTVNRLQTILTQLESRLQAFFEGGAGRLFPGSDCAGLAQRLVEAMRSEIQAQEDGSLLAPNVFTILVPPSLDCTLPEKDGLLIELVDFLQRSGEEAGIHFDSQPVVRIISDSGLSAHEIQVLTAFSQASPGDTTALRLAYLRAGASTNGHKPFAGKIDQDGGAFLIVEGSRIVPLPRQGLTIGRRPDMTLVLEQAEVSRVHAQIRPVHGRYVIFDLDSSGGTYVNGQRVMQCLLHPGDVISLAGVQLVYGQETSAALDQTQELKLD
jgi:hypothetical protein